MVQSTRSSDTLRPCEPVVGLACMRCTSSTFFGVLKLSNTLVLPNNKLNKSWACSKCSKIQFDVRIAAQFCMFTKNQRANLQWMSLMYINYPSTKLFFKDPEKKSSAVIHRSQQFGRDYSKRITSFFKTCIQSQ